MDIAIFEQSTHASKVLLARKTQRQVFIITLVLIDTLALTAALALANWLRFASGLPFFDEPAGLIESHIWLGVAILPACLGVFAFFRLYDFHFLLGGTQEYSRVFNASSVILTLIIIVTFLWPVFRVSRGWLAVTWASVLLLVSVARFVARRVVYRLRTRGILTWRTLIVGTDEEARAVAQQLLSAPTCGLEILGFIDTELPAGSKIVADLTVCGSVEQLPAIIPQLGVEELVISTSALPRNDIVSIFQAYGQSEQVELRFAPGLFEIFTTGVRVKEVGYVPLVSMNKVRLDRIETAIKTLFDYVGSALLLLFLLPVFLVVAILIKRESPGPVFHRRRVIGRGGRPFDAFKFRTMYSNGDEILGLYPELQAELELNHKLRHDPRITHIGERLRRISLDEFPQLFNVLMGQMSLVGPRMITQAESSMYGKWKMNLLTVKPGMTGLWQIKGRSDLSYEERVRLDMYYIRNYTLWLDLQILWQTIPVVLLGNGAY
jgi:exopolysaccharide biosynthesis polyprenyl glycosylphosphotransferase